MGKSSVLRSPKKEEQQVPDNTFQELEILDDLEGFLGIKTNDNNFNEEEEEEDDDEEDQIMICKAEEEMGISCSDGQFLHWELTNNLNRWEEELLFPTPQSTRDDDIISNANYNVSNYVKKEELVGVGDHTYSGLWNNHELVLDAVEETKASLNLNLNYEQVLEAWSNRGSLWAPSFSFSNSYVGEVPNLEEERTRRESSVMRYKEKRQNRLFSTKIRYQVRKVNADKRPRLKGRFVKRTAENKMSKGG